MNRPAASLEGISIRKYATLRGFSEGTVRAAIKTGRITPNSDGSIDVARADSEWSGRAQLGSSVGLATVGPDSDPSATYLKSRAAREFFNARNAKIENARLEGSMIPVAEVAHEWSNVINTLKVLMLGLPVKLARRLAAETDHPKVRVLLDRELRKILEQASAEIRSNAKIA